LAVHLFNVLPFALALVGHEVSGEMSAAQLAAGLPAEHDHVAIVTVTVTVTPTYHPGDNLSSNANGRVASGSRAEHVLAPAVISRRR